MSQRNLAVSFPDHDYRTPYVPGPTSPAPTSAAPMHVQSGPQMYTQQFAPPTGSFPPPKKRMRTGVVLAWLAVGLTALLGLVVVAAIATNGAPGAPSAATTSAGRPAAVPAEPTPAKTYPTPAAANFELAIKTTKKECFGSAGCNIQFTINLAYNGPALEPNSSWDVTYDITGGEDPQTNTLTVVFDSGGVHGTYSQDDFQMISTKSSKAVLKAVVTSVTKV
jgi:hypothetical protein